MGIPPKGMIIGARYVPKRGRGAVPITVNQIYRPDRQALVTTDDGKRLTLTWGDIRRIYNRQETA